MRYFCPVLLAAMLAASSVCDARDWSHSITIRGRSMLPGGFHAIRRAAGRGVYRFDRREETRCVGGICGGKISKKTITVRQSVR